MRRYDRDLYGICNSQKDRKGMREMPVDRKMKAGDSQYLSSEKVPFCKWFDRRSVTMLFSNDEGIFPTTKKGQDQNVPKFTTKELVMLT